jgi:hypothetical protein
MGEEEKIGKLQNFRIRRATKDLDTNRHETGDRDSAKADSLLRLVGEQRLDAMTSVLNRKIQLLENRLGRVESFLKLDL